MNGTEEIVELIEKNHGTRNFGHLLLELCTDGYSSLDKDQREFVKTLIWAAYAPKDKQLRTLLDLNE